MIGTYRFMGGEKRRGAFGPLAAGDYDFEVLDCQEPYQKANGNWVLKVRLSIEGQTVFDQPWSGETTQGEARDGIGQFLLAINRAPGVGEVCDWHRVQRAHGRCRLKVEVAQQGSMAGKEVNRVQFYYRPREVGPSTQAPRTSYHPDEFVKAREEARTRAGAPGEDEVQDIPF